MSASFTARSGHRYWHYLLRGVVTLGILLLLAQTAYYNFDTYFNKQLRDPGAFIAFDGPTTAAAKAMGRLGPDYRILASSLFFGPQLQFIYPRQRQQFGRIIGRVSDSL